MLAVPEPPEVVVGILPGHAAVTDRSRERRIRVLDPDGHDDLVVIAVMDARFKCRCFLGGNLPRLQQGVDASDQVIRARHAISVSLGVLHASRVYRYTMSLAIHHV